MDLLSWLDNKLNFGPHRNIVFTHIPKCGGTSVKNAIEKVYGPWIRLRRLTVTVSVGPSTKNANIFELSQQEYRTNIQAHHLRKTENRFFSGHVHFDSRVFQEFKDRWDFITLLRDPVERFFSNFFYRRYSKKGKWHTDPEENLDGFISSYGERMGNVFARYFSDSINDQSSTMDKWVQQAKNNLKKYSLVGTLAEMTQFTEDFEKKFGVPLSVPHENKSPIQKSEEEKKIMSSYQDKVETLCAPSIEIYEWLKQNRNKINFN